MKIYMARHGESTGDLENLYGGIYNDHLTDEGIDQAKKLGKRLSIYDITHIYTSPLLRAKETANTVGVMFDIQPITIDNLREKNHYGILSGMDRDEAKRLYTELVPKLKDYSYTAPGGEVYEDFVIRVRDTISGCIEKGEDCLIVTHGGFIRCVYREILGLGELSHIGDCSYSVIDGENLKALEMFDVK